jgi:transposase
MGSTRRSFTDEYKRQSVAFALDGRRAIAEVAGSIGVHEMTLRKWVTKAKDDKEFDATPEGALDDSERLELIRLRAELKDANSENAELQMQVEFGKKVATWFAKGKQ